MPTFSRSSFGFTKFRRLRVVLTVSSLTAASLFTFAYFELKPMAHHVVGQPLQNPPAAESLNNNVNRDFTLEKTLGARLQPITPALVVQLKLSESQGALVNRVKPNSPAARAGLRAGDIVIGVGRLTIADGDLLCEHIMRLPPGAAATMTIFREQREKTLRVILNQSVENQDENQQDPEPSLTPSSPPGQS